MFPAAGNKYSAELKDLVLKLLDKNQTTRIGAKNDAAEILSHPAFEKKFINDVNTKQMTVQHLPNESDCIDFD